jgi:hypothetical protein
VSLQPIRGSEDPDGALFRQMEQYVLDHYPNPTRTGCPDSQTLKLLVYEPLTLQFRDAKFLHVMECAECMREVIAFRKTRVAETGAVTPLRSAVPISSTRTSASSSPPPLRMHRRFGALALGATAVACMPSSPRIAAWRSALWTPDHRFLVSVRASPVWLKSLPISRRTVSFEISRSLK